MTQNQTNHQSQSGAIVYIRKVRPDELPNQAVSSQLFAIHDADGNRIGLAPERSLAFQAARQNELTPVSVH